MRNKDQWVGFDRRLLLLWEGRWHCCVGAAVGFVIFFSPRIVFRWQGFLCLKRRRTHRNAGIGFVIGNVIVLDRLVDFTVWKTGGGGGGARLAEKESLIAISFLLMDIVPVEAFLDWRTLTVASILSSSACEWGKITKKKIFKSKSSRWCLFLTCESGQCHWRSHCWVGPPGLASAC